MATSEHKESWVRSEKHNGVNTIEFSHAQSNSLPQKLLRDLAREIHSASTDEETKVIVLRSAGDGAFCAGASFDELMMITTKKEGAEFFSGFAHVINAMRKCPKFIIGRIQGRCVGGGVGLAAAVDYAIAVEGADVKLSELSIGIGPFVVGPVVEKKMGASSFQQLAIDAHMWRNADWARRKGLYAELHPGVAEMDESITRLVHSLSHSSADAMAEMKKIIWKGTENWDEFQLERAAISGKLIVSEASRHALHKLRK